LQVSATQLGEPDIGLLTPPEMARRTSQICGAAPGLPVIADADSGGGSVLNVQRTIRSLIAAGASGCVLEDQAWPKRMGYVRNKEVVPREAFVAKLMAAREVIGDADFFLVARTDARSTSAKHGLEDACTRANLYIVSAPPEPARRLKASEKVLQPCLFCTARLLQPRTH
jgi:2-methylisocitrate lyase-like PEP mutase family enzyme